MNPRLILILLLLSLLSTIHASAISIYLFAKMKNDDQATYITNMVEGAAKLLKDKGQPDQAQKTLDLFGDSSKNGGINQFVARLKSVDAQNRKNAINPNNRQPVLQVEDAMVLTLKDNGIIVPVSYLIALNVNFMPAAPNIQQLRQVQQANQ